MVIAKVYILKKQFVGSPAPGDLELITEKLAPLKDGEFLAEGIYLSIDPYMRVYTPLEAPFFGTQVAKIIESKNPKFSVGEYVIGNFGWRTHTISNGNEVRPLLDFQGLPLSLGLGILGMPGNTAYFGFLEICKPKAGETVVISAAALSVGSTVGQIAKIKGCTVIGIVVSDDRGKWLTEELGFDHFINFKTQNVEEELQKLAPIGVDCYFENMGGEVSSVVLNQMNTFGRISICRVRSAYDNRAIKTGFVDLPIVSRQLKMEGFIVWRWSDRWNEGIEQNLRWIKEGKLKYKEHVTGGFENAIDAYMNASKWNTTGNSIVKI